LKTWLVLGVGDGVGDVLASVVDEGDIEDAEVAVAVADGDIELARSVVGCSCASVVVGSHAASRRTDNDIVG